MKIRSMLFRLVLLTAVAVAFAVTAQLVLGRPARVPEIPVVQAKNHVADLTLYAVKDNEGHDSFAFNGKDIAPLIRVAPGDTIRITYVNHLPANSNEKCSLGPCHNMTNLHFHGLGVSPQAPQDDVLTMMAMPGETLHYNVQIPADQPPGLYWYHTHPHGESEQQVLEGMSGAIIIEGIENYVPQLRSLPERVLVLRGRSLERDAQAEKLKQQVEVVSNCGAPPEKVERVFTVNGVVRPAINIAPGERQFWRIVNASADTYADVRIDGAPWEIVALDGMPLAYHDPEKPARMEDHVLLPPASRLEAIVTGPRGNRPKALRTGCVNTGPDGDPNPAMVLADITPASQAAGSIASLPAAPKPPRYSFPKLQALQSAPPQFIATFTEDKGGFYINGQKYDPDAQPMARVKVGTYQHWRIVNETRELHPMHLHQVHFLAYAVDGVPLLNPEWVDTFNVDYGSSVDIIADFTNPAIQGTSVFHCHLLNHEDKGMMAKIVFE